MASQTPETIFDISDLFTQLNNAFTTAAVNLKETFKADEWKDSPFVYHMPKMHLSMRLVLSHSDGKVKGFFHKESTETQQEVTSTVEIDVVAVPRTAPLQT
jgi:hypothetical protein